MRGFDTDCGLPAEILEHHDHHCTFRLALAGVTPSPLDGL